MLPAKLASTVYVPAVVGAPLERRAAWRWCPSSRSASASRLPGWLRRRVQPHRVRGREGRAVYVPPLSVTLTVGAAWLIVNVVLAAALV